MARISPSEPFGERFSLERPLDGPLLSFDLAAEADRLCREIPWKERGHNAITLAKYTDLRLVLTVIRAGTRMATHQPAERLAIHAISGRLCVRAGRGSTVIPAGHMMAFDRTTVHEIEALEDATFLLTVTSPSGC